MSINECRDVGQLHVNSSIVLDVEPNILVRAYLFDDSRLLELQFAPYRDMLIFSLKLNDGHRSSIEYGIHS